MTFPDLESGRSKDDEMITRDPILLSLLVIYCVLVVLLFVVPRYVANQAGGDGFSQLAAALGVVLLVGGLALLAATISLITTICKWHRLSTPMRIIGMVPTIASVVIIAVIAIIVALQNTSTSPVDPTCIDQNGTSYPCPQPIPKNETYTSPEDPTRW